MENFTNDRGAHGNIYTHTGTPACAHARAHAQTHTHTISVAIGNISSRSEPQCQTTLPNLHYSCWVLSLHETLSKTWSHARLWAASVNLIVGKSWEVWHLTTTELNWRLQEPGVRNACLSGMCENHQPQYWKDTRIGLTKETGQGGKYQPITRTKAFLFNKAMAFYIKENSKASINEVSGLISQARLEKFGQCVRIIFISILLPWKLQKRKEENFIYL